MGKMVGIDLGTTNSVVAIVDGPQARVLDNRDNKSQTRSVVGLKKRKGKDGKSTEELLVGDAAVDNWAMAPKDTITSVKRLMGRAVKDPEVQKVNEWADYEVVPPSDGTKDSVRVMIGGKEHSPIDVSSMILKKLKEDAEFRLGDKVTHAVITVPAYFSERQREATRKAGLKAGLTVMKILDEPTAAAIAFGVDTGDTAEPKNILVYDLGGGTFDIAVLFWAGNVFVPLTTEGDMWLGGDNFDKVIVDHVVEHVNDEYSVDPTTNKRFMAQLRKAAQGAKERLTSAGSTDIIVAGELRDESNDPIDVQVEITRQDFERMITPLVEKAAELTHTAMRNSNTTPDQIDCVIMAGNSTSVPLVQRSMEKVFGAEKVLRKMHAKHCVAIGAALAAARLRGVVCQAPDKAVPDKECGQVNKLDDARCSRCGSALQVEEEADGTIPAGMAHGLPELPMGIAPFPYGTQTAGDKFHVFIQKSEPYPTESPQAMTFFTPMPNARIISIPVYGGNDLARASANELQGQAFAILPPNLPQDTPIRIKLWLDSDGIFDVSAHLEDGTDLMPWVLRGEGDARAIEALEVTEQKIAQKAAAIPLEKRRDLDKARDRVFEEMRRGKRDDYEAAMEKAQNLDAMIDDVAEPGEADLAERVENLAAFAEHALDRYSWGFNPQETQRLNRLIDEAREAVKKGNRAVLERKLAELDDATDKLPDTVNVLLRVQMLIHGRIQPSDPAAAGKLMQEIGEIERAFKTNDPQQERKFVAFMDKVASAMKAVEGAQPKARRCAVCGAPVEPGSRYCPNKHDTWTLKDKSAGAASF